MGILKGKLLAPKINYFVRKISPSSRKEIIKSKEFYSQFIKPGNLCFDVGANIGNRTIIFSELGAKVIAIEPQKNCAKYLRKFFKGNKNIIIVDKALGESEGESEIAICDEANVISTMSEKWKKEGRFSKNYNWDKVQKVSVTTLDNLIEKFGVPNFCKIDVEGFEKNVLKGLSQRIPFISFEFTKELFSESMECLDILSKISDYKVNYSTSESLELLINEWVEKEELIKIINENPDDNLWGDIYVNTQ